MWRNVENIPRKTAPMNISHFTEKPLQLLKNDYTCIEIAIFAIANRKGYQ